MLTLKNEKMSKSLGNIISIKEFLSQHPADVMRLLVLSGSYRGPLVFGEEVLTQSEQVLKRLLSAKKPALPGAKGLDAKAAAAMDELARNTVEVFKNSMSDDFNTAGALAAIFELVKLINQARADGATDTQLAPASKVFNELTGVLGLKLDEQSVAQNDSSADAFIDLLVQLRADLRAEKNWAMSDKVRDGLKSLGVIIEDSKEGSSWNWEQL